MGLKEIYLKGEDKWYGILDRIDAHVPIYKVVDKIDGVVPSFALFIALVALLVLLFATISLTAGSLVSLTITVEDTEGNLLEGVSFDYAIGSMVNSAVTNAVGQAAILVPAGSSVEITVAKIIIGERIFEQAKQNVLVEKSPASAKIVLKEESPAFVERTLVFQNAAGERMAGKAIKVRLSCQNPLVTPSPLEVSDLDLDGAITLREPRDCGIFQATVIEPAEFKQKSYVLNQGTQIVRLEEKDVAKGIVRVRIKDSSGKLVLSSNFNVKLLDSDGMKAGEKYSQNYGEAIFTDVTAGTYSATIEDASGDYGMASAAGVEVSANETASIDIVASKSVKFTLTVKVLDKSSGARISGATLRVVDAEGKVIAEKTTVSDENTVFRLTDQGSYWLSAMHNDYLYETVELGSGTATQSIEVKMEKITASNSGRVEVEVVDEDNLPVKNARVKLRFLDTGMLVPVEPKITDRNGFASFSGMKQGSYYAYAEKFPAAGDNKGEGKEIDVKIVTKFRIKLLIGDSLVQVKAFDEDSQPVREAEAEFFSVSGESLGKIPLTDGTGQFDLKADKQVFAVISHPDFMAVQTMPVQLWPEKLVKFDALMEPKLILGEPKVEFDGIYDSGGIRVQEMKAGNKYVARFKLSVPEEGNYAQGGFHFRVGDESLLVNDPLVIKDAIAGRIIAPLKGTAYTPPLGYEQDSESVTEGDAKWINISWPDLKPMNYYFGFEVRVKSQVMPYTRLPMHYRAWAIDDSDYYIRTPADAELGNAESVSGKQALYAKTLDIAFLEGQQAECLDDFCYSGESLLDQDEGLYMYEPYEVRAGAPLLYTFSILNNSAKQYSNSQLYITVGGIAIEGYKIQNASAQEISQAGISAKSAEGIDLGAFTKGKSISGEINLKPNTQGPALIELKIIADGRVVFLKTIPAQVVAEKIMEIGVSPATIPSYVGNTIEVQASELFEGQHFELKDALVKLSITNPDKTEAFYSGTTNRLGIATFGLSPLDPGTKIRIEAEKPGYYAVPVIRIVDSNILRFNPNSVQASLDTRGLTEKTFVVGVESVIGKDATIESVELTGQFRGLLDEMTMENFTKQYIGTTIPANGTETLQLFKVVLGKNAKEMILRNEKLSGEYHITAVDRETGITWDFIIPLKVDIKLGGLPDNSPCISISQKEWVGATQGNRATMEFEIRNNCMSGNRFVDLENLQAKLLWTGNAIGTVEMSVTEAGGGASNHAVLRSLVWTPLFSGVRAENVYYGILTFTPKAGHLGERAEFEVLINGEIMTDGGPALVGSSPGSIKSSIDVINLEQCIQYLGAENGVEIGKTQDSATFTVDSSKCGETPIEIEICYMDSGCKGGAVEGDIDVTPENFNLTPGITTKEIKIERRPIPGMYGATIFAKVPGSSYRQVHVVDVLVRPKSDEAFYLDKYDFTILGKSAKDSTILTNTQYEGQFNVKASACAWKEASEKGLFSGTGALVGAGVGFAIGVMAPAGMLATMGPAFLGLSFCPPCLAIMVVAAIIGGLLMGALAGDPCDDYITHALPDWIINLRDDAEGVSMDNQMIAAAWNVDNPKILGNNERQDAGIWFENLGIEEVEPTYSTATVTAKKHYHADPTDYGKNSDFGSYKVKDREVTVYTQKFHLKFDTKVIVQEIPPVSFDAYECVQGTLIGRTGPGALPRTKLSWDWSDATGIAMDACDYGNENYVYCDATQFSIELSKKLHAFDKFLEINKDNLVCPTSPMTKYMMEYEKQFGSRNVKNGYLGLSKVGTAVSSSSLEINFEVKNDTVSTQTAKVTVQMTPPNNVDVPLEQLTCIREFDVVAQQSMKGKCTFSELQPSNKYYGASVNIESSTALLLDANGFIGSFRVLEAQESDCWIVKSTTQLDNKPAIEYFTEEAENMVWTPEIPDAEALRNLLHFKAYLMKDGYSEDFQKDFAEYSVTKDFFNAPEWFSDADSGKLADYFADPYYFGFTRRYVNSSQLSNAGLYDVVLDINFVGGNWDLFNAYGAPNAKINTEFYFLNEAYPNSLFYYLPFDGFVGVDSGNGRQGYGMNYENVSDEILVTGSGDGVKTLNIPGSTPVMNIKTDVVDNFEKMNSTASNRGFVLSVEDSDMVNQKNMEFYPNYATPVIMKMSQAKTEEPFSAYFELRASGVPLETGGNLTFWDGAGRCLDYTGVPVVEAFDFRPDREADAKDALGNWQFAYAVDWPKADYGGDVYLKTILYTPISRLFSLKAVKPSELKFITPNSSESQSVELNGIAEMKYNSGLAQSRIATIREVFELAAAGDICVTNSGTRTSFWWNPKSLYEASGHNTSIMDFETGLVAGKTCIDYGS